MLRLTPAGLRNIKRGLHRSWEPGGAHDRRFRHNPVDADTLRQRALHDLKGRHAFTIKRNGRTVEVYHSVHHVRRLDLYEAGRFLVTLRPGLVLPEIVRLTA